MHLLTLEQFGSQDILLRLEHIYEKGEDPALSKPVTMSLRVNVDLFLLLIPTVRLNSPYILDWGGGNNCRYISFQCETCILTFLDSRNHTY